MPLVSQSGALSTISSPTANRLITDDMNVAPTPDELLSSKPYVKDALTTQTALSYNRSTPTINAMLGYIGGSPIIVTYYHQLIGTEKDKSHINDLAIGLDGVHKALSKISGFEIRLKAGLDFSYNPDVVQSQMTGSGYTYPGFNPYAGDLFLYELEPGTLGLFRINKAPNRITIKSATCYEIDFELIEIVDSTILADLEKIVVETLVFDKQRFLMEPGALLKTDEATLLQDISRYKYVLTKFYMETFYDGYYYISFIRKDVELYDPYVTKFLLMILPYEEINVRPYQLVEKLNNWEFSIWSILLNPDTLPTDKLLTKFNILIYEPTVRAARINSLINKSYIELNAEGESDYIFSQDVWFGQDIPENYNQLVEIINKYITDKTLNPSDIFNIATQHRSLSQYEQFYYIPMLLFFLQLMKDSILSGRSNITIESSP